MISPVYAPSWTNPIVLPDNTLSVALRYGLASVTTNAGAVDATFSEIRVDVRYSLFERLEFGLDVGLGMWNGTVTMPGAGVNRIGSPNLMDMLFSAKVAVLRASDGALDLAIAVIAKIPTGSKFDFLGTEMFDFGWDVSAALPLGALTILAHAGGGLVSVADEIGLPATTLASLGIGASYTFDDFISLSATFDVLTIGGALPAYSIGIGARTRSLSAELGIPLYPELGVSFGLSDATADFSMRLGVALAFSF